MGDKGEKQTSRKKSNKAINSFSGVSIVSFANSLGS
jgi:hypothetical protein